MSRKLVNKSLQLIKTNEVQTTSNSLIATTTPGAYANGSGQFYSSITGRAALPDLSADNKVRMGIERIMTQSVYQLQNEFGPNGEPVWVALNDSFGQIRFVGGGWYNGIGAWGQNVFNNVGANDYVEITFYGTGINFLSYIYGNTRTIQYSVDGASYSTFFTESTSYSIILGNRNYNHNAPLPVISGLSLGVHTVSVKCSAGFFYNVQGFEILNEGMKTTANTNTSNQLTNVANTTGLVAGLQIIGAGIPANTTISSISGSTITMSAAATATAAISVTFEGLAVTTGGAYRAGIKMDSSAVQQLLPYNSSFDSGTLGTKGGRVVVYQKADGTVGKAVNPTNASQLTLTSADHSNEAVTRIYHWREFGAGRTDDFSRIFSAGDYAFTLDDGTTTLVGQQATLGTWSGPESVRVNNGTSNYLIFTFVGTGLDILTTNDTTSRSCNVFIDGASVGTLTETVNTGGIQRKVVSGLPYGTHTVKFANASGAVATFGIVKFIVYGPKKPALPAGTVELADYFVMADYVAGGTSNNTLQFAQGSLFKSSSREFTYTSGTGGAWSIVVSTTDWGGFAVQNTDTGGSPSLSYTFFGTGLEIPSFAVTSNQTFTVQIDGINYAGTATAVGASSWSSPTWTVTANGGGVLRITGLTLGSHTVKLIRTSTTNSSYLYGTTVITPVHSPASNLYADLQNTLPVGSNAISDDRAFAYDAYVPKKAWAQAVGIFSGPTLVGGSAFIPAVDLSTTIKVSNNAVLDISYSLTCTHSTSGHASYFRIYVNGVAVGQQRDSATDTAGYTKTVSDRILMPVSAGVYKIDIYWSNTSGTSILDGVKRNLLVREI